MMISTDFQNAQETVKRLAYRPSNERMLQLYSLYKQATVGDCNTTEPSQDDLAMRAKYDAWMNLQGTEKEEAMRKYVNLVQFLIAKPSQELV